MSVRLTEGAIETIISGGQCDAPVLQIISTKKISSGAGAVRYRLLLSDGVSIYSHAMLATQLNSMMAAEAMDNLCVLKVDKYLCNTLPRSSKICFGSTLELSPEETIVS